MKITMHRSWIRNKMYVDVTDGSVFFISGIDRKKLKIRPSFDTSMYAMSSKKYYTNSDIDMMMVITLQ